MYDNMQGHKLLKELNADAGKGISLALDTERLSAFLRQHSNGPERYHVSGHVLSFVPLAYGDGPIFIAPVYSKKEISIRIKDSAHESGKINYFSLSIVTGHDMFSIESLIQEEAPETNLPRVLTFNYSLPIEGERASNAFSAIMREALLAANGCEDLKIGTTGDLAKLLNSYMLKTHYRSIQPVRAIITKETVQLPPL